MHKRLERESLSVGPGWVTSLPCPGHLETAQERGGGGNFPCLSLRHKVVSRVLGTNKTVRVSVPRTRPIALVLDEVVLARRSLENVTGIVASMFSATRLARSFD